MQSAPAHQVLARVAEGGGRLLAVRREPAPGAAGGHESRVLRLVFDLGAVDLVAGPGGALLAQRPEDEPLDALPVDAAEEEPWWALLGSPLARVQVHEGSAVLVQFREDADSPRIFVIEPRGDDVGLKALV